MSSTDVELIEQTFERLAEASDDITPLVYDNFFALRPEAIELFDADSEMNRGQMLNEIFTCLLEQARGKTYLEDIFAAHVADHVGMGVSDMGLYQDFLLALRSTIVSVLEGNWPCREKVAFERQCELMNEKLTAAERVLAGQNMLQLHALKLRNPHKN